MHLASCQLVSSVQGCKEIADNSSGVTRCYPGAVAVLGEREPSGQTKYLAGIT